MLESSLKDIGMAKDLPETDVAAVLQWFTCCKEEWMILFDNADDTKLDLASYLPECSHGNIIITTRNESCIEHGESAHVPEMHPHEALCLLAKAIGTPGKLPDVSQDSDAASLVLQLGYLPLAIVQAGSYIRQKPNIDIKKYLDMFNNHHDKLLSKRLSQNRDTYATPVYAAWDISFRELKDEVKNFLYICTYFKNENISEQIFSEAASSLKSGEVTLHNLFTLCDVTDDIQQGFSFAQNLLDTCWDTVDKNWSWFNFQEIIDALRSYSFIQLSPDDSFSIHSLVHKYSITHVSEVEKHKIFLAAQIVMHQALPKCMDPATSAFQRMMLPHVYWHHCCKQGKIQLDLAEQFAELFSN